MIIPLEKPTSKVKSPISLAHVVLRTANYHPMVDFYKTFLGAEIKAHRIAITNIPGMGAKDPNRAGLEHMAFTFATLDELALTYLQRKDLGIVPNWCVNHGPTTSLYYNDPDGNRIETQVDKFDTVHEANEFMGSKLFAENPIGTDFEPEELIGRLKAGEDHASIEERIESGPRGLSEDF